MKNTKDVFKLTNPQTSIWNMENFFEDTTINNICTSVVLYEELDIPKIKQALNNLVKNHDSFRIQIHMKDNIPYQSVAEFEPFDVEVVNAKNESEMKKYEKEMVDYKFNIIDSVLYRFKIVLFENKCGGIILNLSHMIADSWSLGLTVQEYLKEYHALKNNETLDEVSNSYIDYINAEQEYKQSEKFENDKKFWNDMFETIPELATIPTTKKIKNNISSKAKREIITVDADLVSKINNFCKEEKLSAFNFLMAIYSIYIGRVSNLDNFVIGTPILNRTNFKEKHTTGMFVNTVPVKIDIPENGTFTEFAHNLSTNMMSILKHQKYSYNTILEDLREKHNSLPNLYNIIISYQITKAFDSQYGNYKGHWAFNNYCGNDMNIHISDVNDTGTLEFSYDYLTDKYSLADIKNLHARIMSMVNQILESKDIQANEIEIVTEEEKNKILNDFNNTAVDYPKDKTIVDLFEEQVEKTPDNIAVVFGNQSLTYKELNEKANQLANHLLNVKIEKGNIIGILLNRSLEMVIGLLAILKTGSSYLPIDPEYPIERISYMLENSNVNTILLDSYTSSIDLKIENKINIELNSDIYNSSKTKNLKIKFPSDSIMYLIYTSGSTGKPKGVMITHKNVNNFLLGLKQEINFDSTKTMLSLTTICFDIFVLEIWGSLTSGMKIILASNTEQTSPSAIKDLCNKFNVDMIQTTPSRYSTLISDNTDIEFLNNISDIMVGGEPFPKSLLENLQKHTKANIFNMYGPTETTVWSTIKNLTNSSNITIGSPIANTKCYILDKNKKLLPPYVSGELYIGGDGVSKGYWKRDELTNEKFLHSPFNASELIYQTGDLAYYTDEGEIVHLGRSDFQVKIRGYRIELGEIEHEIINFPEIVNCVVNTVEDKTKLCAYYISNTEININSLREYLHESLPNYMIPNYFLKVDKFPYTPNGKIDKKSLPDIKLLNIEEEIVKPTTETEAKLVKIWRKLFDIKEIGTNYNFFNIGGDSLLAIKLSSIILAKFNVNINVSNIFEYPTIHELANLIDSKHNVQYDCIKHCENKEFYNVSSAQRRIYYASKVDSENSVLYNIPGVIKFNKKPNIKTLNNCFTKLIQRHSSLRTYFEIINNDVKQKILDKVPFELETSTCKDKNIDEIVDEFVKPFDLSKAPLFRAKLITTKNSTLLLYDMHHIISDGLSLSILDSELCKLYNNETLDPIEFDYVDYSEWEHNNLKNNLFNTCKEFWINQFNDEIPILNMPTDYQRPIVQSFTGNKISYIISEELTEKINKLSKKLDVSNYMFLLACYFVLLSKYTSQEDIIIGSPVLGRNKNELLNVIGMFVNSLPLRNHVHNSDNFKDFLNTVKQNTINAIENSIYPFDELVKDLNIKANTGRNPLFDTMFIYQNNKYSKMNFDNIQSEVYIPNLKISKFDLSVEVLPIDSHLKFNFEYSTKLFKEETINQFSKHYINIINSVIENIDVKIGDIDILSDEEKNKILNEFNDTKSDLPENESLVVMFERQVAKNPDNIAIIFENKEYTYGELNKKANRLANYLNTLKITQDDVISIILNRSFDLIVSIYAAVKLGVPYILIDPSFPNERINYIIEDSNSKYYISNHNVETNSNITCINLNNLELNNYDDNNTSFDANKRLSIIYTSGSTGKPKGVKLNQIGFVNLLYAFDKEMNISAYQNILGIATVSFDMFSVELYSTLSFGNTLVLANEEEQKDILKMSNLILNHNVEFLITTPSRMKLLLENKQNPLKNIKAFQLGGEKLTADLYNSLIKHTNAKIFNGYGPTEITACCSNKLVESPDINIGKPLNNVQIYICDQNMNLVPIGVPGEICVAGLGVADGYINNPEMTNKNFVKNPYGSGTIYKTGDLGRYTNSGEIEYIGRSDSQIKIRGLRIELSEIEASLNSLNSVEQSVVLYKNDDNLQYLVAFVTSNDIINVHNIKHELSGELPKYMIPRYIIQVDNFPITKNGKIDKKSLENYKISIDNDPIKNHYVAPVTDKEKLFCKIWSELLNIDVGITDDLFDIGADSLLAIRFKTQLLAHDIDISYSDIFKYRTIKNLCEMHNSRTAEQKEEFDYSAIDKLLKEQSENNKISNSKNNVLLLGSTGFVGIHIVNSFIKNTCGKIYCIVREKGKISTKDRFINLLHFYFGKSLDKYIGKRIIILKGAVTKEQFALSDNDYNYISKNVDVVINSAANVKHYGNDNNFKGINIDSLNILTDFCLKYNKRLIQISSLSISGHMLPSSLEDPNITYTFDENNLYIGQHLDTLYTKSKFEAEKLILKNIVNNNLNAQILRLGNITSRYSDGRFQINPNDNAFAKRLKSFIQISAIPDYLLKDYIEFTPVDFCADAIITILNNYYPDRYVYHINNLNFINFEYLVKLLKKSGIKINLLDDKQFVSYIDKILLNNSSSDVLSGIINDFDINHRLHYSSNVITYSNISTNLLKKNGFKWPKIKYSYIKKYLKYFLDTGFIK